MEFKVFFLLKAVTSSPYRQEDTTTLPPKTDIRASIARAGGRAATIIVPAVKSLGLSLDILIPCSLTADG